MQDAVSLGYYIGRDCWFCLLTLSSIQAIGHVCSKLLPRFEKGTLVYNFIWGVFIVILAGWYGAYDRTFQNPVRILVILCLLKWLYDQRGMIRSSTRSFSSFKDKVRYFPFMVLGIVIFHSAIVILPYFKTELVIPSRGNVDVYSYISHANLIVERDISFSSEIINLNSNRSDVFGAFSLIAFPTILTGERAASMVSSILLCLAALFSMIIYSICRNIFLSSERVSIFMGLQFLVMPLFVYIWANYFMSQMISSLVLLAGLYLLFQKENWSLKERLAVFFPSFSILFLTYFATFVPYALILGLSYSVVEGFKSRGHFFRTQLFLVLSVVTAVLLMGAVVWERVQLFVPMLRLINTVKAGWSLQYIAPVSMMGLNLGENITFVKEGISVIIVIVSFLILFFWALKNLVRRSGLYHPRVFWGCLFVIFWLCYNGAYYFYGAESYNQWKFATFFPMLFGFVLGLNFIEWLFYFAGRAKWGQIFLCLFFAAVALNSLRIQSENMTFVLPNETKNLLDFAQTGEFASIIMHQLPPHMNMAVPSLLLGKKIFLGNKIEPYKTSEFNHCSSCVGLFGRMDGIDDSDVIRKFGNEFVIVNNPWKYLRP